MKDSKPYTGVTIKIEKGNMDIPDWGKIQEEKARSEKNLKELNGRKTKRYIK